MKKKETEAQARERRKNNTDVMDFAMAE